MADWAKLLFLICFFGFLKEFQPIYPYLLEYINREWSSNEDSKQILLLGRYSYIGQLIIICLIADVPRQNPLLITLGVSGIAVIALWTFGNGFITFIFAQILYGTFMATEIAYHTYMYARSPPQLYEQATAYTRSALLAGKSISISLGQYLVHDEGVHLIVLAYITVGAIGLATIVSLFLPSIKSTTNLLRSENDDQIRTAMNLPKLSKHFLESYKNYYVLKWSIYWIMATACFIQVEMTFSELMYLKLKYYNIAIDITCFTLSGFVACIFATKCQIKFKKNQDIYLLLCSLISGGLVFGLMLNSVTKKYVCIVLYAVLYYYITVFASAEIAKHIPINSYGLVFAFNTFIAVVLQTFLMLICATDVLVDTQDIEKQYFIYGLCHFAISALYVIIIVVKYINNRKNVNNRQIVQ